MPADDPVRARTRSPDWVRHEAFQLDREFSEVEEISIIERRRVANATLVDRALSMSSSSRARIGARADELARDIGELMAGIAPGGSVTEVVTTTALIGRRSSISGFTSTNAPSSDARRSNSAEVDPVISTTGSRPPCPRSRASTSSPVNTGMC